MMIGDRENVAKKAVEEHKIRGSLRSSRPKALLQAAAIHFKLSIDDISLRPEENNLRACVKKMVENAHLVPL